ncbi:unnamed protein product [Rotaria sp. Silwood2]|nr:unnamed protein product [Rotaria sp. Silwood2]
MCDTNSGTSLKWNLTGVTVAGTNSNGANANQLHAPGFIYVDANYTLYVCDSNNNRVQKWTKGASTGTTVAGSISGSNGNSATLLQNPIGIDFDANGYMYIADYGNNRVQRFPPNSNSSTSGTTVAGIAGGGGSTNSLLHQPADVMIDDNFNLFITDLANKRVVKWAANATNGTVLINAGTGGAAQNQFNAPYGLVLTSASLNEVYFGDNTQRLAYLWAFEAANPITTYSTANSLQMDHPSQMMLDSYGNLYVADTNQKRVIMFCANSTIGQVVVGTGTSSTPTFGSPTGIAFDSDLNLYVSDDNLNQVVKYSLL